MDFKPNYLIEILLILFDEKNRQPTTSQSNDLKLEKKNIANDAFWVIKDNEK